MTGIWELVWGLIPYLALILVMVNPLAPRTPQSTAPVLEGCDAWSNLAAGSQPFELLDTSNTITRCGLAITFGSATRSQTPPFPAPLRDLDTSIESFLLVRINLKNLSPEPVKPGAWDTRLIDERGYTATPITGPQPIQGGAVRAVPESLGPGESVEIAPVFGVACRPDRFRLYVGANQWYSITPEVLAGEPCNPRYYVAHTGAEGTYIRTAPGGGAAIKLWRNGTPMAPLNEMRVVESQTWVRVSDPDGNQGWVRRVYLE